MEKHCIVTLMFFFTLFCVYCTVDFVKASVVTAEKSVTEETYFKVHYKTTMMNAASQDISSRRRSIQEQGYAGQEDVCVDIIGRDWNMTKQGESPCRTLVVWVPKRQGFFEFIKINEQSEVEGGFSIAIFCYALNLLPFNVQPIFIVRPFDYKKASNGPYDHPMEHIQGKTCMAIAGDITIRGDRVEYVDFTFPYLSSDVYMLVRSSHAWNQTLWTFLKPFTWRLWITIIGACIFTGVVVAILEYRVGNPKFMIPFYRKLIMVI